MAYFSNDIISGHKPVPTSGEAAVTVTQIGEYKFPADAAAGDIIEIGVLPARHYLVGAKAYVGGTAVAHKVHLLAGTPGDTALANRTAGAEIADGSGLTVAGAEIAPAESDRGIGIVVGTGGATKDASRIRLILQYAQG